MISSCKLWPLRSPIRSGCGGDREVKTDDRLNTLYDDVNRDAHEPLQRKLLLRCFVHLQRLHFSQEVNDWREVNPLLINLVSSPTTPAALLLWSVRPSN
ncbi:hypothetical protein PGTUg99_012721 [Puccinia graminis f. sp. tritici]|uniref:Uncharacterized protein n=1 Tax=Puccinia graminis f. sp. tritici TaxID=56615 RepID=A0A5B0NBN1_PUCGR|nr:hypothetical protein PGTUg99_012721 [Puccinia graminis f. sp. tritici]